ncbi:hypothetical protein D3C73_764120 [compost metagenome]
MTISEDDVKQLNELTEIMKNSISMELRIKNSEVKNTVEIMKKYGLVYKNSWASMELEDHTVIDFWKKELIKL